MTEKKFEAKRYFDRIKENFVSNCVECGDCVEACPYFSMGLLKESDPIEISEKRLALLKEHKFSEEAYTYSRACLLCKACKTS